MSQVFSLNKNLDEPEIYVIRRFPVLFKRFVLPHRNRNYFPYVEKWKDPIEMQIYPQIQSGFHSNVFRKAQNGLNVVREESVYRLKTAQTQCVKKVYTDSKRLKRSA